MRASRRGLIALLGGAAGIGLAPILVRWSEAGPSATGAYRVLLALPFLWSWSASATPASSSFVRRLWSERGGMALAGFCFAGDLALWHSSIRLTTIADATLLTNFAPIFVFALARFYLREPVTGRLVGGLLLALAGGFVLTRITWASEGTGFAGDLLALGTALFYAGYLVAVKRLREKFSGFEILAGSGLISGVLLAVIAWGRGENFVIADARGWAVVLALAFGSHVGGQGLITYALAHLRAGFVSVALLLQPVISTALAWALLRERLGVWQSAGALLVLAGVALASLDRA